jgi:hypothetical protein
MGYVTFFERVLTGHKKTELARNNCAARKAELVAPDTAHNVTLAVLP